MWDPTVFTKNRDWLQNGDVFAKFMTKLLNHPQVKPLLSDEHFSVDGTLIEAWASQKSFTAGPISMDTHASVSDPDCRLYRKAAGREAKLCYMGHATMENRHGLAVAGMVTLATGTAERRASETMLRAKVKKLGRRITGEDKAYDTADHVTNLRAINVTPHVAQNDSITSTGKRRPGPDRTSPRLADALPFGMQYCRPKPREPIINENSCGRRSRLNSRGFARPSKETNAGCGHIGGLKLRSDDGGRREPSGY